MLRCGSRAQGPSEIDPSSSHGADNLWIAHSEHEGDVLGDAVASRPILDHVGHIVVHMWVVELEGVPWVVVVDVRGVRGCRGVREDAPPFFTILAYYLAISIFYVLL